MSSLEATSILSFDDGTAGLREDEDWRADQSKYTVDLENAPPGANASLSLWCAGGRCGSLSRAGLCATLSSTTARQPRSLRFHIRVADTQKTKGFVLLCDDEQHVVGDNGNGVAVWFCMSGREHGFSGQAQLSVTDGERFIGMPLTTPVL